MRKRNSFKIFLAVQNALFLRELSMRFTSGKAGMFWTFFEPFFQILFFVLIKMLLFGTNDGNFDFAAFLALNFIAFNMFKSIVTKSMAAFAANKALFVYKQVKPIDTIIARVLVELFITAVIIIIFLIIGTYFHFDLAVKNFPIVVFGFVWLAIFSFSMGIFFAVSNVFYPSVGKVISMLMTFLMFGSAIFYSIEMLPIEFQSLLLLNPLTHFIEMIHGYYFYVLNDEFVNYLYMLLWTLSPLYIGLWFYKKLEEKIVSL